MAYTTAVIQSYSGAKPNPKLVHDLTAGVVAGQIAGLIMAVLLMLAFTVFRGKGPAFPAQVVGALFFDDSALQDFHAPVLFCGLVVHQLGPALFWGAVFGLLVHALQQSYELNLVRLGIAVGLLSQIVDVNLILPHVMKALYGHDIWAEQVPIFWSWAAHLDFGLSLAVFPWAFHRLAPHFAGGSPRSVHELAA